MPERNEKMIPNQRVGSKLDTTHEYEAQNEAEAKRIFGLATARLLNVNEWEKLCGPLSANFTLTDKNGQTIDREPMTGDHFRIDIPGPGPTAGEGFDWVEVEAIEDKRNSAANEESVTIRVRPSPLPGDPSGDIAHFFSEAATSSFRVARIGNTVRAEVHGRNETPNTEAKKSTDKMRNAMVGTGATMGLSNPQWKSLVKGLLDSSTKVA